jgi:PKD repeat protein
VFATAVAAILLASGAYAVEARESSAPLARAPAATGAWDGPAALTAKAGELLHAGSAAQPHPSGAALPWTNLTSSLATAPSPREGESLVYDAADGYVLLFGGLGRHGLLGDTWKFQGGNWTNLSGTLTRHPSPRFEAGIAYDAADGEVVLFGGLNSTRLGDTWVFAAGTWSRLSVSPAPSPREGAAMTYDAADGYVLLFGGEVSSSGYSPGDTWEFVNQTWTNVTAQLAGAPPPRESGVMAFDGVDGYVVLYGGKRGNQTDLADTWSYVGGIWTNLTPSLSVAPPKREFSSFAFDPWDGFALLVGGFQFPNSLGDEWEFGHGAWTQLSSGVSPSARYDAGESAWYPGPGASGHGKMLFFGGRLSTTDNSSQLGDTWTFKLPLNASPSASLDPLDANESVTLSANPAGGYAPYGIDWSGLPAGCTGGNVTSIACAPSVPGIYSIEVQVNDSVGTSAVSPVLSLTVHPRPTANVTATPAFGDLPLKTFLAAAATGGTPPFQYLWNFGDGTNSSTKAALNHTYRARGTFTPTVNVTDAVGVTVVASTTVTVAPAVQAFVTVSPATGPAPLPVTFNASATGGVGPYTFVWRFGDSSPTLSGASVTHTYAPGTYTATVTATDSLGSSGQNRTTVIATSELGATLTVTPATITLGESVLVTLVPHGGAAPYGVAWSGVPAGCTGLHGNGGRCIPTEFGRFSVRTVITDSWGRQVAALANLTVNPELIANATASFALGCAQGAAIDTATFHGTASGGTPGYLYLWRFGDGSPNATGPNQTHTYPQGTTYTATLTVTDATGATSAHGVLVRSTANSCSRVSGQPLPLNPLFWAALAAVVVAALVAILLLARRRRRRAPPAPPPAAGQPI